MLYNTIFTSGSLSVYIPHAYANSLHVSVVIKSSISSSSRNSCEVYLATDLLFIVANSLRSTSDSMLLPQFNTDDSLHRITQEFRLPDLTCGIQIGCSGKANTPRGTPRHVHRLGVRGLWLLWSHNL